MSDSNERSLVWTLAQRAVRGMPSLSFSSGSNMPRATASSRLLSAMMGKGSSPPSHSTPLYARMSWLARRHVQRHLSPNILNTLLHASVRYLVSRTQPRHLGPSAVVLQAVHGQGDHLDLPLAELAAQPCGSAQLCGADGSVVPGVREQDPPPRTQTRACLQTEASAYVLLSHRQKKKAAQTLF